MILQSEILRIAEQEGVPANTVDKNWVLGHLPNGIFFVPKILNGLKNKKFNNKILCKTT